MLSSKLRLDFASQSRLRQGIDDDTADLIDQLCTRSGMIMEDMSALVLTTGSMLEADRAQALICLEMAASQIAALIAAARAIQITALRRD